MIFDKEEFWRARAFVALIPHYEPPLVCRRPRSKDTGL